jgi:hypothetical protein
MIYVLVDRTNEIVDKVDSVTLGGAKHYFRILKKMKDKDEEFDKLWKVITKKEYDLNQEAFARKPSSEWWKEEETYLDIDAPITKSGK